MGLVLASASPRRRELLARITSFTVEPSRFEEKGKGLSAEETAAYFAESKAREVLNRFHDAFVLGADTVVSFGGAILGKPHGKEDAANMLRELSGKVHEVITGVCLAGRDFCDTFTVKSQVEFFPLSEELIARYVASGLPMDKAGAYGIQDGYPLVKTYTGSYTNIVGLPVEEVRSALLARGAIGDTNVKIGN